MLYNQFKILLIKEIFHSRFGRCIMVCANPITQYWGNCQFETSITKRTSRFLFSPRYLEQIQQIASNSDIWTLDRSWYTTERLFEKDFCVFVPIYIHTNSELEMTGIEDDEYEGDESQVLNKEIDFIPDTFGETYRNLIPNFEYKWHKLLKDFEEAVVNVESEWGNEKDEWAGTYIECECAEKEGFFSWLFEDESISSEDDFTEVQNQAYEDFLFSFDKEGCLPNY